MYLHAYIRRLTKRDKSLPYRTLSTQYRNIAERFRPSCSSLTFIHLPYPYTPLQLAIFVSIPTRQPGVISILPIPRPYVSILVLPIIQAHAYYVQLVLFPHSNHPPPSTVRYSPSSAHSRLAHGACNFHVAPSSSFISVSLRIEPFHIHPFSFNSNGSRTSESARSFALSLALCRRGWRRAASFEVQLGANYTSHTGPHAPRLYRTENIIAPAPHRSIKTENYDCSRAERKLEKGGRRAALRACGGD